MIPDPIRFIERVGPRSYYIEGDPDFLAEIADWCKDFDHEFTIRDAPRSRWASVTLDERGDIAFQLTFGEEFNIAYA